MLDRRTDSILLLLILVAWLSLLWSAEHDVLTLVPSSKSAADEMRSRASDAQCMMLHMRLSEKKALAEAVSTGFVGRIGVDWQVLRRVAETCRIEERKIVSRHHWPTMYADFARADSAYFQALSAYHKN